MGQQKWTHVQLCISLGNHALGLECQVLGLGLEGQVFGLGLGCQVLGLGLGLACYGLDSKSGCSLFVPKVPLNPD